MTIWLNGVLVAAEAARLDPRDRGFTLGDGLFETIRCHDRRPAWLDRHLARLRHGADYLGIPLARTDGAIAAALDALIAAEGLSHGSIRLTLSRGPAPRGVLPPAVPAPTLLITTAPPAPAPGPVRVVVATVTRRNQASPLSRLKTLNFLDTILARREAAERGAEDAILLDTRGRVAEASVANLFILDDGALKTPPLDDGALPGIARGLLLDRAGAVEASLAPEDLMRAQAVFLSNSLGLRPVAAIDGRPIGDGSAAELVSRLEGVVRSGG